MKFGIAPQLVVSQIANTASWATRDPRLARLAEIIGGVDATSAAGEKDDYFAVLLAAHFTTVATFVPTDVDVRIRHHTWAAMNEAGAIETACAIVDDVASWDVDAVSARVLHTAHGRISGHDGEWLAVRAGALGRAIALGATGDGSIGDRLADQLETEVLREERIMVDALAKGGTEEALKAATIIAHNLGDLSRVVTQWPRSPEHASVAERFARLGHPDAPRRRDALVAAGTLNKALMALENHRFLALRKPRALRTSRDLLLPIGPWFDGWGETIARHASLEHDDRAEVVAALLELHLSSPDQLGCLRALAGIHRATRGGLEIFVPDLPARIRKEALRGRVRDALDVSPEQQAARLDKRYRMERERR